MASVVGRMTKHTPGVRASTVWRRSADTSSMETRQHVPSVFGARHTYEEGVDV